MGSWVGSWLRASAPLRLTHRGFKRGGAETLSNPVYLAFVYLHFFTLAGVSHGAVEKLQDFAVSA
jgi:hypothetical protein